MMRSSPQPVADPFIWQPARALDGRFKTNPRQVDELPDRRFLILDDDPDVGRLMQSMTGSSGVESRFTSHQQEFFQLLNDWAPTHIAVDLVMPNMDGVQVLVGLAERACRARIIITSGVGDRVLDAARRSAVEHGLDIAGVLSKPFSVAELRRLLLTEPDSDGTEGSEGPGPAGAPSAAQCSESFQPTVAQLLLALERDELRLVYQPKVECLTGQLTGFEALARWVHPTLGVIPPACFIPFAEQNGLIDRLTYAVLDQALAWLTREFPETPAAVVDAPSMAVNISASALRDGMFVEHVMQYCRRHGVRPERLVLELTESAAMADPVASLALLTRLRVQGFRLSLDDFGNGFSSMLQLVRLPFSELKIDQSFVGSALRSAESESVVKSIVELGRRLGLRVVAEGVEDKATMHYLKAIGCDEAQGYFIARPMTGDLALQWVASHR